MAQIRDEGIRAYGWSLYPQTDVRGFLMFFEDSKVHPAAHTSRSAGFPLRCFKLNMVYGA